MSFKPDKFTVNDLTGVINLSESMAQPHIKRIQDMPNGQQKKDEIVKLIMALGFAVAATELSFFAVSDPDEFGQHMAAYISETIKKLKEAHNGSKSNTETEPWSKRRTH